MTGDPRIAFCPRSTWWDSVDKAASSGGRFPMPRCPVCGSSLFEYSCQEEWDAAVKKYETESGHVGYTEMVDWGRGKHFSGYAELLAAYGRDKSTTASTGDTVQ